MKKILSFLALIVMMFSANAQIMLEHTYKGDDIRGFITNTKGIMYYVIDETAKQIKFYNTDHSLYKTVSIETDEMYYISVYYPSEKLFNSDDKLEFIVESYGSSKLYDEDGVVLMNFGDFDSHIAGYAELISYNGLYKLLVCNEGNSGLRSVNVYSLPGSLPSGSNIHMVKANNELLVYPNPAKEYVNIPYKLSAGETVSLGIYSESGKLVEEKTIDNSFDKLQLNVSRYKAGVYIYRYKDVSGRFIVR